MNMKKSIAGVMAGAMAVSAMAATVSADEETVRQTMTITGGTRDGIELNYDLKTYVYNANSKRPKVSVTATWKNVTLSADDLSYMNMVAWGGVKATYEGLTFGVDNNFINKGEIYAKSGYGADIGVHQISDGDPGYSTSMKEFKLELKPYKTLKVVGNTGVVIDNSTDIVWLTDEANRTDGAVYSPYMGMTPAHVDTGKEVLGGFHLPVVIGNETLPIGKGGSDVDSTLLIKPSKYNLKTLGYSKGDLASINYNGPVDKDGNAITASGKDVYGFEVVTATMTYELENKVKLNMTNAWSWTQTHSQTALEILGYDAFNDVDMNADVFNLGFWSTKNTLNRTSVVNEIKTVWGEPVINISAFSTGESGWSSYPFKTELVPSLMGDKVANGNLADINVPILANGQMSNDVIQALSSKKAEGRYYTKPIAVINDAIANHNNVTFTFTTYNGYVATKASNKYTQWMNIGQGMGTGSIPYGWYNPYFGQHLYTNIDQRYALFGEDDWSKYGSYSDAWAVNLFTSALVVNNDITMQLSDTDMFEWGQNTVSFDWFDIIDDGKITDAKTFLRSMLLYTPVEWYWDSLTIKVSDTEDEDIDAGEELNGDGDELVDEDPIDDFEEPVDEEPADEEPEPEPEPVKAPSPETGNAPVALAVIPVALAAAAVVAKKRG